MKEEPVPQMNLGAQFESLREELEPRLLEAMRRGDFILGSALADFEREFARYCGCRFAVGVASGLDALKLILRALGLGPGDEAILPANSFIATALAVTAVGARPVLADCEPAHFGLDPERAAASVTPRTRAILPVHLYGHPADMDALGSLARRHGIEVVEDAAQAHGARHRGRRCGSFGRAAAFSFYPAKNLGAFGDGGAVTTQDAALAARVAALRNYGSTEKYRHEEAGENSRLDALQAVVLSAKLRRLDAWNARRRAIAARYSEALAGVGDLVLPAPAPATEPVWHQYVVRTGRRDALLAALRARGVGCGIHYPIPIHLQPAYAGAGWAEGDFPVAERCSREVLSLPMYPELDDAQVDRVARAVREAWTAAGM